MNEDIMKVNKPTNVVPITPMNKKMSIELDQVYEISSFNF